MAIIKRKKPEAEKSEEEIKNEKIIAMAKYYVSRKKSTMAEAGQKYGFTSGTVSGFFKNLLPNLDPTLYTKVRAKIDRVKAERQAAFVKDCVKKSAAK